MNLTFIINLNTNIHNIYKIQENVYCESTYLKQWNRNLKDYLKGKFAVLYAIA